MKKNIIITLQGKIIGTKYNKSQFFIKNICKSYCIKFLNIHTILQLILLCLIIKNVFMK